MTVSRLSCRTHPPSLHMEHTMSNHHPHRHKPYATLCTRQMPSEEAFQTKQITSKQGVCVCTRVYVYAVMLVCVCVVSQPVSSNLQVKGTPRQVPDRQNSRRCPGFHTQLGRQHTTQHCVVASSFHSILIPGFHHPLA